MNKSLSISIPNINKIDMLELANFTKDCIVADIVSKTDLSRESVERRMRMRHQNNHIQLQLEGTLIPITEYNPSFQQTGPSRALVFADTGMTGGPTLIKRAFHNPKAGFIARRKGTTAYPLRGVFGPSIASLYRKDEATIMAQVDSKIKELITNG